MEKIAIEFIASLKDDFALSVFQVIDKTTFVDIHAALLQPAIALIFLTFELSIVDLILVWRGVMPSDELVVFEVSLVGGAILGECSLSKGMIFLPIAFIRGSVAPTELPVTMLLAVGELPFVSLIILV